MMPIQRSLVRYGVSLALCSSIAMACECVSPSGKPVAMGDQTNIIVWNSAQHMEHFIRDAKFQTNGNNFGFVAPTPSKPSLAEVSPEAFDTLASLRPIKSDEGFAKAADRPGSVSIVQQVDVAGYRATTLLASDSKALARWMRKNGYKTTPSIEGWTKTYITKGWYLTAFKVLKKKGVASTGTVRMSFKTDRPFNPYFVPNDNINSGHKGTLKVFFVSNGAYQATVGKTAPWQDALWIAPVHSGDAARLAGQFKLAATAIPPRSQVEAFEDHDFPKPAQDDIYFESTPLAPKSSSDKLSTVGSDDAIRSQSGSFLLSAGIGASVLVAIGALMWRRSNFGRSA